jgi:hypothetical protein
VRTTVTHRKPAPVRVDEAAHYEVYRHTSLTVGTYMVPLQTYVSTPRGEERVCMVVGCSGAPYETQLCLDELLYPVPGAEAHLRVAIPDTRLEEPV